MKLEIAEGDLRKGVLSLVLALVEIIRDVLRLEALRRMEGGSLTAEEVERLGRALMELDSAIEQIEAEQGVRESVRSVREGLDGIADDLIGAMADGGSEGS